ncbi:helix-turn-helix domain-containing protein [Hathewaya histolytica]|uniref:Transposase IS3/IS911 family protein n=1 Tax=Hathewaya histolytica TaxID=1498 RepID=A0A4V6KE78_HATHI|nr:helix-turn-helix domain-containing protein [Hathewaya histolytica]VTQ91191.1 transposase IS3/IS911 family protein [Hathewaya histolytica]VTQ93717.1 transposase IS3/IS911 family protein [Hathewaya histolytica]
MSRSRYSAEQRIMAVEDYLSGRKSMQQICLGLGISSREAVRRWVLLYQIHGATAFDTSQKNKSYSKEFKIKIVEEYIAGIGSVTELAAKYNIPGVNTLQQWILKYNSDMELKDYDPKQEVYMAEARRKTTFNERKDIVKYCIEHKRDYKATAEKYDVSYSQVYNWVHKYDAVGEEGLTDNRGRHKSDEEVDELEKLRRENKRLKRQLEERDMTVELLKKVKEFERRRF